MNTAFTDTQMRLLRACVFCLFLGRAWGAFFFDLPFSVLFWDEAWMRPVVEGLGGTWNHYIQGHAWMSQLSLLFAGFWALAAFGVLLGRKTVWAWAIYWGIFQILFVTLLHFKNKNYAWAEIIEHGLQLGLPWLYVQAFWRKQKRDWAFILSLLTASTFIGHGLFALNVYNLPATWINWCIRVFGFEDESARSFLWIMGFLDVVAAVLLFVPILRKPALYYCVVWGTLTALARVVANFYIEIPLESLNQWGFETVYRLLHGGAPLLLLLYLYPHLGQAKHLENRFS